MSNIDIRKFVDVNIVHHSTAVSASTRNTTVLFVDEADYGIRDVVVSSKSEFIEACGDDWATPAESYGMSYFDNGGAKLYLKSIASPDATKIKDAIKALPDEYIVVAFPGVDSNLSDAIKSLNDTPADKFYGIKTKLAICYMADADEGLSIPNVIKVSDNSNIGANYPFGFVAAYLSRIDISKPSSVKDYDFTPVKIDSEHEVDWTDDNIDAALEYNNNIVVKLAGQNRIVGGNTSDGKDLVNEFMLIVLQQTVSEKVLNVLVQKIKGESGCAMLSTAIAQELDRYVYNGFLATDKVWSDDDLTVEYGDPAQTYTIVAKDTPLLLGYQVKVLPYKSLTPEDKVEHKAPPIYLVLATSYGIRKVTINGEVF